MMLATTTAMTCIEVRQSWFEISQAASGDMLIGAIPIPAETSETARLRWVSNQPVTHAIIGAKIAAARLEAGMRVRRFTQSVCVNIQR